MFKSLKKTLTQVTAVVSLVFTIVPETFFGIISWSEFIPSIIPEVNIIINRIITFFVTFVLFEAASSIYNLFRRKYVFKDDTCHIEVAYGDIFKQKNCRKVIPFDECFSTHVGNEPADIKESSICGQYLKIYPNMDMKALISRSGITPERSKSKYMHQDRYLSGKLIQGNDNYLLMAFAHLQSDGIGYISYDDYIDCLFNLWKEIDNRYSQSDVCIPVLGSGLTRFNGPSLTQQELLDIIIATYKLSSHKIKKPSKLRIICQRVDGFSLRHIGITNE